MAAAVPFAEPWRRLPPEVADVIEPELPRMTGEILAAIAAEVPEYARPLEGRFGRNIETGVTEALHQFVALIRDPEAGRGTGREVYRQLGEGELRQGRTLDSLQAAYRVGARVAWRQAAEAGRRADLDAAALSLLAESMFAYIDELSADSVEGYARAQSERQGELQRRRRDLLNLVLAEPPPAAAELRAAASLAGWQLPERAAPLVCEEGPAEALARVLPAEALTGVRDGHGCALLPDPEGPGRRAAWVRAAAALGGTVAIGPAVPLGTSSRAWQLALSAMGTASHRPGCRRAEAGEGPVVFVDDNLAEMIVLSAGDLSARLAERRLTPLADLTPRARERMLETALAHFEHGTASAMAAALHIHPQTARYRMARLRELLGPALEEPAARFELELALRAERLGGSLSRCACAEAS